MLREEDHFKRPWSRCLETYYCLCSYRRRSYAARKVTRICAHVHVYTGMHLWNIWKCAAICGVLQRWKGFYYSQSNAPRCSMDPFRFAGTGERKSKRLAKQICKWGLLKWAGNVDHSYHAWTLINFLGMLLNRMFELWRTIGKRNWSWCWINICWILIFIVISLC